MTDTPCTPEDRAAIVAAARYRAGYLIWLAGRLREPRYSRMTPEGQSVIRDAASTEIVKLCEVVDTVRNPIRESPNSQTPSEGR